MRVGQIYRYSRPYSPEEEVIDDLPNYFYVTHSQGQALPLLEAGINPISKVVVTDQERCPAILISSSPHKIGSPETPWQDFFDPDNGHAHYFGDNRESEVDPGKKKGNKALLEQFELHSSSSIEARKRACPIVLFKRVRVGSRSKGNVQFQGYGIITQAARVTQYDRAKGHSFPNYAFDFTLLSLADENESFSWEWITKRRDGRLSLDQTLAAAPKAWRDWVQGGKRSIEKCRRRVVKLLTISSSEQKPREGSRESAILNGVYDFYRNRKTRFEALAAFIASRVISEGGGKYRPGWITPSSSDGGADFIGHLDVGSGLAGARIIVLGQAKCEKLTTATGGNHIARTVARLRRGWIGAYVTTSYFSESVQREVLDDKYPIILINGLRLALEVDITMAEEGISDLREFLDEIDNGYEKQIMNRHPEELLLEG